MSKNRRLKEIVCPVRPLFAFSLCGRRQGWGARSFHPHLNPLPSRERKLRIVSQRFPLPPKISPADKLPCHFEERSEEKSFFGNYSW